MRFRSTLLLGLLLAALAAYLYAVEFKKVAQEGKKETLVEFDQDAVTGVTLTYPDRKITLEKKDGEWRLTEPTEVRADEMTVKNLVRAIATCEVKKSLKDVPKDLAPFGLDKPFVVVSVRLKGHSLPDIRVGKTTPIGYSTYVQRSDQARVVLTGATFHSGMNKKVKDLRDKSILRFSEDEVRRITIVAPDREIELARTDGRWKIAKPRSLPADEATVRTFLSSLRNMRALEFPDDAPTSLTPYGLDAPRLTITLFIGKDQDQKGLLVGKETEKKNVYVKGSSRGPVYEVAEGVYRDIDKSLKDFRDKTALAFDKNSIRSIQVRPAHADAFTLKHGKAGSWSMDGRTTAVDTGKADQFLSDLHALKGYEILADSTADLARYGLADPLAEITLNDAKGPVGTLLVGEYTEEGEPGKQNAVMQAGTETILHVRDYLIRRVNRGAASFLVRPTHTPTVKAARTATPVPG